MVGYGPVWVLEPKEFIFIYLIISWHLMFQEERLNMNWSGNFDTSIGKSAGLVIWRSEVRIFILKSRL